MLAWVGRFLMKDFQAFLFVARSLLAFLSFRSLVITSFHVFLGRPLGKLLLIWKVLHLLDQTLFSILSRWPNHYSLLSCKHSLMVFNFSLVLSFSTEIIGSFLYSLITSSSLTGQNSLPYSINAMYKCRVFSLPFAPKGKPLLAKKGTKSLNLRHPLLIFVITLSNAFPLILSHNFQRLAI